MSGHDKFDQSPGQQPQHLLDASLRQTAQLCRVHTQHEVTHSGKHHTQWLLWLGDGYHQQGGRNGGRGGWRGGQHGGGESGGGKEGRNLRTPTLYDLNLLFISDLDTEILFALIDKFVVTDRLRD